MIKKLFFLIAFAIAICNGLAQGPFEYRVSFPAPQTQTVEIECRFLDVSEDVFVVQLPVWRPGKYQVLDPAGTLYHLRVSDENGRNLRVRKMDKATWEIDRSGAEEIVVRYTVYANSIGDRTRHVDDTHAFLSGSSVFLYSPTYRDRPIRVRLDLPASWQVATGLDPDPERAGTLLAESYDVLVDSPIEVGLQRRLSFEVEGHVHEIVIWGEVEIDESKLLSDFEKIVRNQISLWGSIPYDRYVFLIHVGPGFRGGTEHINSTIMQADRKRLEDPKQYKEFLGLVSHEFFHTWNIKQIRPSGLSPYQYQVENYTSLLWLVEGTTSYYDDLSLVRAGLITSDDYYERLSKLIDSYRKTPGREVQSLAESSFDAWIKFTHPTPHSPNTSISFYSKGALVSLLLDLYIRTESRGEASLDDLMRRLYQDFPLGGGGYTEADLVRIVSQLTGQDSAPFFESFVTGLDSLNLEVALESVGLSLERRNDEGKDGESEGDDAAEFVAYFGVNLKGATVSNVLSDGPAYQAGVMAGDEILALDGRRLASGTLSSRLGDMRPGTEIDVTLFRRDQLKTIRVKLASRPRGKWKVKPVAEPSETQRRANEDWIKRPWSD